MKKILSLMLALGMICVMLTGCGGNKAPASNGGGSGTGGDGAVDSSINFDEDPYEVNIQFVGMFEENNDIPNVEAALNEITQEKINCTVNIVPLFIGDLPSETSMAIAGEEKMDVVAVGLTQPITAMVPDGLLLPLDDLLAARGQDALAATADVAEAQKINGQTYGVSGYTYAAMAGGFVYNKTMAEEYGIDMHDGMTMEELGQVGEQLKAQGVPLTTFGNSTEINYKFYHGGEFYGTSGAFGGILDPVNSTEIVNIYDTPEMRDFFKTMKSWADNGYLMDGQLTDTTSVQEYFNQQKIFGTSTGYTADQLAAWVNNDFEVGIVRLTDPTITTGGVAEFMLGIASNCERPDKAMDLINLIYADPEVANLLQYGVEGNDYVPVEGTENVITLAGTPNEDRNNYYATFGRFGNQMDRKIMAPLTDSLYDDMQALEDMAHKSAAFGYSFNGEEFSAESAAIASVLAEQLPALNAGLVEDVDAAVDKMVADLQSAGIDDCIAGNQAQLDAYLAENG